MANLQTKTLGQVETVTEVGSTDNVLLESNGVMKKIAASSIGSGGNGAVAFRSYFFDDNRYVCDDAGTRVQFDDLVNVTQYPIEIPVIIMTNVMGTMFFYLVSMADDSAYILSADMGSVSAAKLNKESATGYAVMRGLS